MFVEAAIGPGTKSSCSKEAAIAAQKPEALKL
jgi:hypothetical protein